MMTAASTAAQERPGPWDLGALRAAEPGWSWAEGGRPAAGSARGLYYAGEPYRGRATRVFAYGALPEGADQPGRRFPAMVLVHGGGGTAFAEWAELWAGRGYVALAMDLAGQGPDRQRLADGGPDQGGPEKFFHIRDGVEQAWPYHAVGNVVRAINVLESMDAVDPQRIGITGISWGGYLTCIVAGLDDRLAVAVPVYGCGFLGDNSGWLGEFEQLGPTHGPQWLDAFDPSVYLPHANLPMLFVTGAKDPPYPLDSFQKSYRLVPGPVTLRILPDMTHGHTAGWSPIEIGLFVDAHLRARDATPPPAGLARITPIEDQDQPVGVRFDSPVPIERAQLHFTTDTGPWVDRQWQSVDATVADDHARARLPDARPLTWFFTLTDTRGAIVSTPHRTWDGRREGPDE